MKKAFKLLGLCLVAITLSVNFSACGDEGEDDNNKGNGSTNNGAGCTTSDAKYTTRCRGGKL